MNARKGAKQTREDSFLPRLDLGQENIEAFLESCMRSGVPSLLFTGPEGSGKEYSAVDFARKLCCMRDPVCRLDGDLCDSCLSAAKLEHPAIHLVYPTPSRGGNEGEEDDLPDINKILEAKREDIFSTHRFSKKVSIRIARARAIIKRAYTKPFRGPYNIFIIVDAHSMREEAQNSLLKLIEEPPLQSIFILVTPVSDALLYTIRSRCQRLRFPPLKKSVVEKILVDYYGFETQAAGRAASLSRGNVKLARDIASSYDDTGRKEACELAGKLKEESEAWLIGRALVMSKGASRDHVALFLQELELYFRDIMAADEELYFNIDDKDEINRLRKSWDRRKVPAILDKIRDARDKILRRNLNMEATLALLFLDIKRL